MPTDTVYNVVSEVIEVSMDSIVTSNALKDAYTMYDSALTKIITFVGVAIAIKVLFDILFTKFYTDYKIKKIELDFKNKVDNLESSISTFSQKYQSIFSYKQIEFNIKFAESIYIANKNTGCLQSFLHYFNALNYLVELEPDHKWYFSLLSIILGINNNWKSFSGKGTSSVINLFERVKQKLDKLSFISFSEKNRIISDINNLCNLMDITNTPTEATETEIPTETTETEIQPETTETEISTETTETEISTETTETEIQPETTETEIQPEKTETEIQAEKADTKIQPEKTETDANVDILQKNNKI